MSKHWVREEIRHNLVEELVKKAIVWSKNHKDYVLGGIFTIAAVIVVALYFTARISKLNETAWEKFFVAQQFAYAGDTKNSFLQIDSLEKDFPDSIATYYAMLFKADMFFGKQQFKEAADIYLKLASKSNPQEISPIALSGLCATQQALGDYPSSINTAQDFFIKYPNHFLSPQVYNTQAKSYELSGKTEDAIKTYKKISQNFADTYWAKIANGKLTPKN